MFFVDDEAEMIVHISSGDGQEWKEVVKIDPGEFGNENGTEPLERREIGVSLTPGGVFRFERIVEGLRNSALGGMWDPAYFNYGIAMHGALNVPLHPASHGCIRMSQTAGRTFHQYIDVGDQVFVWDGIKEPEYYAQNPGAAYPRGSAADLQPHRPHATPRPPPRRRCRRRRWPPPFDRRPTPAPTSPPTVAQTRRRRRSRRTATARAGDHDDDFDDRPGGHRRLAGDDLDVALEDTIEQRRALAGREHLEPDVVPIGGDRASRRAGHRQLRRDLTPPTRPSWRRSRPIATRSTPARQRTRRWSLADSAAKGGCDCFGSLLRW